MSQPKTARERTPGRLTPVKCLALAVFCFALPTVSRADQPKPQYTMKGNSVKRAAPHKIRVAIVPFNDVRTTKVYRADIAAFALKKGKEEKFAKSYWGNKDLSQPVAEMIAEHFGDVGLFVGQEVVSADLMTATPENLSKLKALGYDAVLTGTISKYMGSNDPAWSDRSTGAKVATTAVAPVGIVAAIFEKGTFFGRATLGNVQLVDTSNGKVIWTGDPEGSAERKLSTALARSWYRIAEEALNNAVKDLADQMDKTLKLKDSQQDGKGTVINR